MTDKIAVSVFVAENDDGSVSVRSLAADNVISKAMERMLAEQATNLIKYMRSAVVAAESIDKAIKP